MDGISDVGVIVGGTVAVASVGSPVAGPIVGEVVGLSEDASAKRGVGSSL